MAKKTALFDSTLEARLAAEKERHTQQMLRLMDEEIERLRALRHKLTGSNGSTKASAGNYPAQSKRKRNRRDPEGLKKIAEKVATYVKSKAEAGATSIEILEKNFGDMGPSISKFVEKYAGIKLKHKGPARGRKYFHS